MSDHQDTILYGLKSGAAAAKTPGERMLLTKAADEIASLRSRLEAAYRVLQPGQFLTCHKAKRLLEEGHRDVAACGECEICLYTKSVSELESEGGGDAPAECPRCGEAMTNNTCRHCGLNF